MPARRLKTRRAPVGPEHVPWGVWSWLTDQPYTPGPDNDGRLRIYTEDSRALWLAHRDQVVSWFAVRRPGERPSHFWQFEALPPRRRGESDAAFLRRCGLLLPGE